MGFAIRGTGAAYKIITVVLQLCPYGWRLRPLRARHAAGTAVRAAGVSAAGVSASLIFPDSAAAAQHARARFAGPTGRDPHHTPFLPARPLSRAFVLWSQPIDSLPRCYAFVVWGRAGRAGGGRQIGRC